MHLGRQAIYDSVGDVVAYELLFRDSADAVTAAERGTYATGRVLVAAWTEFGLSELVGSHPVFVNLTPEFVRGDLPLPVAPSQVGVEIQQNTPVDADCLRGVEELAERGFTIVLDNFRHGQDRDALLPLATYVKVDLLGTDERTVELTLRELAPHPHLALIAYRLEDAQAVASAMDQGFVLFQGNALGHPHVLTTRRPTPDPRVLAELIAELERPAPDMARLVALHGQDPAMALGLRRAAESNATSPDVTVGTVEQAGAMLGVDRMREWGRIIRYLERAAPTGVLSKARQAVGAGNA